MPKNVKTTLIIRAIVILISAGVFPPYAVAPIEFKPTWLFNNRWSACAGPTLVKKARLKILSSKKDKRFFLMFFISSHESLRRQIVIIENFAIHPRIDKYDIIKLDFY